MDTLHSCEFCQKNWPVANGKIILMLFIDISILLSNHLTLYSPPSPESCFKRFSRDEKE
jgi:hypothetical protein